MQKISKLSVSKRSLYIITGFIWSVFGILLLARAYDLIMIYPAEKLVWIVSLGIILAFIFHFFIFIKIARRNIGRITSLSNGARITSLTPWKSHLTILIVIALGIFFENISLAKHYLASLYIALGGALLLASISYYKKHHLVTHRKK